MPYLGVGIQDGLHTTIIHFKKLEGDDLQAVLSLMDELQRLVKAPPYGTVGDRRMLGGNRRVPVIMVNDAQWFHDVYNYLSEALTNIGVKFSQDFDYRPHVTNYTRDYTPRSRIPYIPYINLDMGSTHEGGGYAWEMGA